MIKLAAFVFLFLFFGVFGMAQTSGEVHAYIVDGGGQTFNVRAYGAKCNGSTDDTAAIQAAITAAAAVNGTAFVPATTGGCVVASFLTIPNNIKLKGERYAKISFTGNGGGACSDAQNPVNTGFIRWSGGNNRISGLNLSPTNFSAGTCIMNLQDAAETSGVEIDHCIFGSSSTSDTNIGIYSYSNDTISIHDNLFKYIGQPIFGGAHTWAKITIGPNNVFYGQDTSKAMVQTPTGANCFSVSIESNVFEGYYTTNGIGANCGNGLVIKSNYFGDSSATGGVWITGGGTLIGNYIDGSGQQASGGKALSGTFTAIGNWIYGTSLYTGGGTYIANVYLSGPSGGCFVNVNNQGVVESVRENFTSSGGAANSYCAANGVLPHPIIRIENLTDATSAGLNHTNMTLQYIGSVPKDQASLPACDSSTEGNHMTVIDSTTNTHGETIAGGSTNHVLAYCDGTNWVVAYP